MEKPVILLITGSFALPEFYDSVVEGVASAGYEIKALHLQSAGPRSGEGRDNPSITMYDDARLIAEETTKLAEEGKTVLLVAHSYGGIPASESVRGLTQVERQKNGKAGGLVGIAYVTALVPELGKSAMDVLANMPPGQRDELQIDEKGWMYHSNHTASAALSFSDLPSHEGEAWLRKFPKHSAASFATPLTFAGYTVLPVSYLVCEGDLIIPVTVQREEIAMIERESGRAVSVTSISTGHCPMATAPEKVVNWIVNFAESS